MYAKQGMPALACSCEKFDRSASYRKTSLVQPSFDTQGWAPNLPLPTGDRWYRRTALERPHDLLRSRNRAFMGSHQPQGAGHDHHPLRSTAACRPLGPVTQNAGTVARNRHRSQVHPTARQGHLPSVRHRSIRKRVPDFIDCRVPQSRQTCGRFGHTFAG